jgi:hypothetical protein
MSTEELSLILGVVMSLSLAVGPWMVKIHAKLAVIARKIVDLCDRLERVAEEHQELWHVCNKHESRLDTHDVQLSHIAERLKCD